MRAAAAVLALALTAGACGGRQLTNRQVAVGAVTAGVVVGVLVLISTCDQRDGGFCGDPDQDGQQTR